jgi:glycosyltransferase involved in cell wall biosynthesis
MTRLLMFNLATDADDPILGFATGWITALAKRVEVVHVITMRAGRVDMPGNVQVYSVGKEKGYSEPRRAIEFYRQLLQVLGRERIDVCFSHMMPIFTLMAAPILKLRGTPTITWYAHRQVTIALKLAHHLSAQMVSINASSYRYRHDKLATLGHGIDIELFSPDDTPPECPPILLSVGRLSPLKGLSALIEAVSLLRQRGHDVRCALVGETPERDRSYAETLRRQACQEGLEDVVSFVGAMPNRDVVRWYRRCLAHVNCSPADHSLDKAALEAMACGKPSLSSTAGFRDTMAHWAENLLFQHGNAEDLANKLVPLLSMSDAQRHDMGRTLRQRVIAGHSLDRLAQQLVDQFAALAPGRSR